MLTPEQADFARHCVARWIDHVGIATSADADHSALLLWLFSGKEPFPHPPPCSFSCPDYEFAEGKERLHCEVGVIGKQVAVNQSLWDLESRDGDTIIARHGPWRARLTKISDDVFGWKMQKIEEERGESPKDW